MKGAGVVPIKVIQIGETREMQMFRLGDTVRIKSGSFAAFTGRIEGINQAKALLKIVVEIFGRSTSVKLKFTEVEQVSST